MTNITISYTASDGHSETRQYVKLVSAQRWAHKMVGEHPEIDDLSSSRRTRRQSTKAGNAHSSSRRS
jgi:hypothetical protein